MQNKHLKFFFGMLVPIGLLVCAARIAINGTEGLFSLETALYILGVTFVATLVEAKIRHEPPKKRLDQR